MAAALVQSGQQPGKHRPAAAGKPHGETHYIIERRPHGPKSLFPRPGRSTAPDPAFSGAGVRLRDGSDPIFVEEELAALLEAIRLHFGCPVAITSGFRTTAHNASIPGASPHSQHLYGRAADFRVEGVSVAEAAAYAETLLPGKGGIGRCPPRKGRACGWVHLDTRSAKARLDGLRAAHPAI